MVRKTTQVKRTRRPRHTRKTKTHKSRKGVGVKSRKMDINNKRSLAKKYWKQIRGEEDPPRKSKSKITKKVKSIKTLDELMKSLRL